MRTPQKTTQKNRTLILAGGGVMRSGGTKKMDAYFVSLLPNDSTVLFLPTASGDRDDYISSFNRVYAALGVKTKTLKVCGKIHSEKSLTKIFSSIDGVYIGGGSIDTLKKAWSKARILNHLLNAYAKGVPVMGLSAGAVVWHQEYANFENSKWDVGTGYGVLKGRFIPHFKTETAPTMPRSKLPTYTAADGAALLFINEKPHDCIKEKDSDGCHILKNGFKMQTIKRNFDKQEKHR